MDFTSPFNPSSSFSKMRTPTSDVLPPLHLASLLQNVSPSQLLLRYCSFGWIAELCDGLHVAIQPLLQLLKDENFDARCAAVSAFGKFAEQREL
jgi:hypothetical protein